METRSRSLGTGPLQQWRDKDKVNFVISKEKLQCSQDTFVYSDNEMGYKGKGIICVKLQLEKKEYNKTTIKCMKR